MSRLTRILNFVEGRPELVIEIILAAALIVFAVYLGSPWYVGGPTTAIGNTIEAGAVRVLTAVIYLVPSITTLVFFKNPRVRNYGTFGLFLAYFFATILRLLTVGVVPFIWLFSFTLALVAAVCYIVESRRLE